jgi:hypothetical protein
VYVEPLGAGTIADPPRDVEDARAMETVEPEGPAGPVTATTSAHPIATRSSALERPERSAPRRTMMLAIFRQDTRGTPRSTS